MRLLNIKTRELELFNEEIPSYAILSHTWGTDEISMAELNFEQDQEHCNGYQKILNAASQAARDGLSFIWVDTCCIDKTNGSEVSEAINSMYKWYQNAAVCYVYLSDVNLVDENTSSADGSWRHDFRQSRWFTRGWTLQELIAPREVYFFDFKWEMLGIRAHLADSISQITGIPIKVLRNAGRDVLDKCGVAERMSWASRRNTTRAEDISYSLLGIFGITMPILYGEGTAAFHRLQYEILRKTSDHSTFAWISPGFQGFRGGSVFGGDRGSCTEADQIRGDTYGILGSTSSISSGDGEDELRGLDARIEGRVSNRCAEHSSESGEYQLVCKTQHQEPVIRRKRQNAPFQVYPESGGTENHKCQNRAPDPNWEHTDGIRGDTGGTESDTISSASFESSDCEDESLLDIFIDIIVSLITEQVFIPASQLDLTDSSDYHNY